MESDRPSIDKPRLRDTLRGLPRRVWGVSLGSLILSAGSFLPTFIVLYLAEDGHSSTAAGLVLGASGVGSVLGSVIGGYLTDTIGRRPAILLSVVGTAGLTALVPFVGPIALIVALVGLIGLVSQIHRPAMAAVLVDSVSADQRLAAFGVLRFAQNIGVALGGAVGGVVASISYVGLFLGEAAALLLFGLIVTVLLRDTRTAQTDAEETETETKKEKDSAAGYRQALGDPTLVRFLLMSVFAMFVYIQTTVGLPLHVSDVGMNARDFGLLMALNGVLVVLFELPLIGVVSKYRPHYVLAVGNLFTCVGLSLTGFTTGMGLLAVTVLIWTIGEMVFSSIAQAHLASLTPPGMIGRYQGLYGAAYTIGTGAGPIVGGALYMLAPWTLWVMVGVLGLVSAQLCLRLRRPDDAVAVAHS